MAFQDLPLSVRYVLLQALRKPKSPAPFKFFEPFWSFSLSAHLGIQKQLRDSLCKPKSSPSIFSSPLAILQRSVLPLKRGSLSLLGSARVPYPAWLLFFYFGLESAIRQKLGYCGVMRRWMSGHTP